VQDHAPQVIPSKTTDEKERERMKRDPDHGADEHECQKMQHGPDLNSGVVERRPRLSVHRVRATGREDCSLRKPDLIHESLNFRQ
jgi:hypothetical protein